MNDNKIDLIYTARNSVNKKGETLYWVNFENIKLAYAMGLKTRFKGYFNRAQKTVAFCTKNPLDKNDKDTQNIIQAYNYLVEKDEYNMPPLDSILNDMENNSTSDKMTNDEINQQNANADEMWIKFMKDIDNPETQSLIMSIGQYFLEDETYGWQLTLKNAFLIRSNKPDATFVQTRKAWREKYGRGIKDDATKLLVNVPNLLNKNANEDAIDQTMRMIGHGSSQNFSNLSHQQQDFVDITSRDNEHDKYIPMTFYDISDTFLFDTTNDNWSTEVGFKNNLTGELNDAAIEQKAKENNISDDEAKKIYNSQEGNIILIHNALVKGMKAIFPDIQRSSIIKDDKKMAMKAFESDIRNLSDHLIEEKCKIVKKENRLQGIEISCSVVLCLCKLKPKTVAKKLASSDLTLDSYYEVRTVINTIITLINKYCKKKFNEEKHNMITEIEKLKSVDSLLSLLGITRKDVKKNEMNQIKEEFFKVFNKIKNHISI